MGTYILSPMTLLTRNHRPTAHPPLTVLGEFTLHPGRVHELCGTARRSLAMIVAARCRGPILWITPAWEPEWLNPDGMRAFIDPGRVLFISAPRPEDLLWCAEEALRSGAAPLIVADLPEPPPLTPVRRLHLAAEASATPPLGLLLTPGDGGAQGVESRWSLTPCHGTGTERWHLDRRRARTAPQKRWTLKHEGETFHLAAPQTSPDQIESPNLPHPPALA